MDKEEIVSQMEDIIHSIPTKYYADILYDSTSVLTINRANSGTNINAKPKMRGVVFRLFNGRKFYEIANPDITRLKGQVETLLTKIESFNEISLVKLPPHKMDTELEMKEDFTRIAAIDKIHRLDTLYTQVLKSDPAIKNVFINFQDSIQERIFYSTEDRLLRQVLPRIGIQMTSIISIDEKVDSNKMTVSGQGGWEIVDRLTDERLNSFALESIAIAKSTPPPSGTYPVICDPSMTGMLAHAIFGHGVQGDTIVEERSFWRHYYHDQVASNEVNISDSLQSGAYGNYFFDDEGVVSQKTPIIEEGMLNNYLHSRITATILGMPDALRGNGRRQSFMHPIFPRNSNTFFEPGDHDVEEMIRSIKFGVLIENGDYGMEEFDGSIQCNSKTGHLIENGEVTKKIKGVAISGNARDFLMSIDAVSKGPPVFVGLNSRKGLDEWVPVTYGGVFIKAEKAFINPG